MTESNKRRRAAARPSPSDPLPDPDEPAGIDPYASVREGRKPTAEELDAFLHAHDLPHPSTRIDPRHGPYDKLPRTEDGRISAYYFCTREEIEEFGLREPPRRHRRDSWTPEEMADFIDALGTTGTVAGACAYVGKSRMSAYRLRARADAGHFARAWDEALRHVTRILADTAYERALEGVREQIWYKGEPIGERVRYNDRLLMFLLRVRDPHGYAPIDELERAQRLRPLEPHPPLEKLMDAVETSEDQWRRALEVAPGDSPALQMLNAPAAAALAPPVTPLEPAQLLAPEPEKSARDEGSHV